MQIKLDTSKDNKGITAPKGFMAYGLHSGIRKNKSKRDLALVLSDRMANAAALYTKNLVIGAPCTVTKNNIKNSKAQAIICNSGIANTCASDGIEKAQQMCEITANEINRQNPKEDLHFDDVIVASTGVIGPSIDLKPISKAMPQLVKGLSKDGNITAAQAIMTTDTFAKQACVSFEIEGKECNIGAMVKGSGMIAPNLATMLAFASSDVNISAQLMENALATAVQNTFNMVTVDGDTSTNDMLVLLSNGAANNSEITEINDDYNTFLKALTMLFEYLSKMLAKDGEGATKLIECTVKNANTKEDAKLAAKAVVNSALVKAAMFGCDANWGRVLCAIGYCGANFEPNQVDVSFSSKAGQIKVCENGSGIEFDEELAEKVIAEDVVNIKISLSKAEGKSATAWGCDLSHDYVTINGSYRT